MFTTDLDVVNACIATMGEAAINTLEDYHPHKDSALLYLAQANKSVQKRGYWFNQEIVELHPDLDSKFIYVPQDALSCRMLAADVAAQRGKRFYDRTRNTYEWDSPITVELIRLLAFEALPFTAADYVAAQTLLRFQREYDGDGARTQQLLNEAQLARAELLAEDTRHKRPNLLATPSNLANVNNINGWNRQRIPYTPGWPRR